MPNKKNENVFKIIYIPLFIAHLRFVRYFSNLVLRPSSFMTFTEYRQVTKPGLFFEQFQMIIFYPGEHEIDAWLGSKSKHGRLKHVPDIDLRSGEILE